MKICLLCAHYPPMPFPCGAADFVQQYANQLVSYGHQVTVLTSNPKASSNNKNLRVEIMGGKWDLPYVMKLAKWPRLREFDIIDFQFELYMYGGHGLALLWPLFFKRGHGKLVLTFHSQHLPFWGGRLWRFLQILPYDGHVFYSRSFMESMAKRFPKKSEHFLFQGFPANIAKATETKLQTLIEKAKTDHLDLKKLIVYFGHIAQNRGLEDVVDVLSQLKKTQNDFHLMMVGQFRPEEVSYHRDLVSYIKNHNLEGSITFTDRVDDSIVSQLFKASDICILPFPDGASFKNGSLACAISHHTPTITTVSDLTERELVKSDALMTYKPGDQDGLKNCFEGLLQNSQLLSSKRKAMTQLDHYFTWEDYLKKRNKFYQSLLSSRSNDVTYSQKSSSSR